MSNIENRKAADKRHAIGRERVRRCDLPGNSRYGVGVATGGIYYKRRGRWRPVKCTTPPSNPYARFSFYNHDEKRRASIRQHAFVCRAFRGPPPFPRAHAAHLNDDPTDNRPKNLRWKSARANFYDAIDNGSVLRLGIETAKLIRKKYAPTRGRLKQLAAEFDVNRRSLSAIMAGQSYPELGRHPLYMGR